MKTKVLFLMLVVVLAFLPVASFGQYSSTNKKAVKLYESAVARYGVDPAEALRLLDQALVADPEFGEAMLTAGDISMAQRLYDRSRRYYQQVIDAKRCSRLWKEEAAFNLKVIDFRQQAMANPVPFQPVNMGASVNSCYEEYFPALTVDGRNLVFTRRFPRNAQTTANTPDEEDFYVCQLGEDGNWSEATRMEEPLNSHDNEGAQCISQDGRIMFFTACGRNDGTGRCDIYMCVRRGDKWSKPRNLGPGVNSGGWESQPSFSIDGKTLYFVSDRRGGYGGMDIWMTTFEDGHFSSPQNLGPNINTAEDETCPFIHYDDQTLYFASKGHLGMGGSDLFLSRRQEDGTWGKAENLGYPINTEGDESSLVTDFEGRTAYMSSNRFGGFGGMDIFSFELPEKSRPTMVVYMRGIVTDAKTNQPLAADIQILDLGDGINKIGDGRVVANTSSDAVTGEFLVSLPPMREYALNVSAKNYLFYSSNVMLGYGIEAGISRNDLEWKENVALNPIVKGESMRLYNVFFESGRYELLAESHVELDKVVELMKKNPSIKMEIGGHTDNVGKEADNLVLSEQRAKSVYDYLVGKGIDAGRLSFKGYGESRPVDDNGTDEGRYRNRRTELTVI